MRSWVLLCGLLLAAGTAGAQTSLTIYSDGRVLMRATMGARVPAGVSIHRLEVGPLDAGSVFSLDPAVAVVGTAYHAGVDEASALRRAIGRRLVFDRERDTVVAEVLGVEPERFRLADGSVVFGRPGRPRYPADLAPVAPSLELAVRSGTERGALALGWFTAGASWSASYDIVLGRGTARVHGRAAIASQTVTVQEAELQVLAGEVGRARGRLLDVRGRAMEAMAAAAPPPTGVATEEAVGEVHIYTLPGRHALSPGVTTTVALFEPASTTWERRYVIRGQIPWIGPLPSFGEETRVPVEVHYLLQRPARTEFGARPLPGGLWRIYEPDGQGRPQLVGEAGAGHTPAGQPLRLAAGAAFDLAGERVQTEYTTTREGQRTIAFATYRVTVRSAKDSAVTVEVLEERGGEWSVIESSTPAERVSSSQTRFRLSVPARGEAVLRYRVRVVW
jgi:hypothetical protein